MPLYVFKNKSGSTIEKVVPRGTNEITENGDKFTREIVTGFGVSGVASNPNDYTSQIKAGYHELENAGGRWKSEYSKKQIKKIWGI
tara:strand:- start:561 stop:818 length:258 start_codon:yes stop_codon:yes gene_type:complete